MGGSGHGNSDSDTSHVHLSVDDLNFERRLAFKYAVGGDLKPVKEGSGLDCSFKVSSEWQQNMNILAGSASSQGARIDFIEAGFDVSLILSKEIE